MTNKFIAGNCVGLPKGNTYGGYNTPYFESLHILSQRDVERGFYNIIINGKLGGIDLDCVVHRAPNFDFIKRDQTLLGKSLQPVSHRKMVNVFEEGGADYNLVTTYILIKGVKTRCEGVYYKGTFYFNGMNCVGYKAKVYIDEEGFLRSWKTSPLSDKQKKQCYNPVKEKEAGFEEFHNMVRGALQSLVKEGNL